MSKQESTKAQIFTKNRIRGITLTQAIPAEHIFSPCASSLSRSFRAWEILTQHKKFEGSMQCASRSLAWLVRPPMNRVKCVARGCSRKISCTLHSRVSQSGCNCMRASSIAAANNNVEVGLRICIGVCNILEKI